MFDTNIMKVSSGHIIFDDKIKWKNLLNVFPELMDLFFTETNQLMEDPDNISTIIEMNLIDLRNNRKPIGFSTNAKIKMIFPIDEKKSLYFHCGFLNEDVYVITEKVSKFLASKGIKHDVEWDKLILYQLKKKKRRSS